MSSERQSDSPRILDPAPSVHASALTVTVATWGGDRAADTITPPAGPATRRES